MDGQIRIDVSPSSEALSKTIEQNLLASLRENVPPSDYAPLTLVARDAKGELRGGLDGSTAYGWLLIKALWVAESERGQGLGTRLMRSAEAIAASQGCHGAWLDTSSTRAAAFYSRLGYASFGTLQNAAGDRPPGHARVFLSKRF